MLSSLDSRLSHAAAFLEDLSLARHTSTTSAIGPRLMPGLCHRRPMLRTSLLARYSTEYLARWAAT
ncbi:hypothetical protein BDP55DRAFT_645340 [Colletotrichum godetiae]|uniref:Uncharacterized protein n=1 Tax=Colletotrichum godetiae TaxID=1209918 RepID=A0AAJ0AX61_9PEZI|nr:uncharacterized protein BDP55DRAFT_645340 [Colletotrichum godetiae]KAK1699917.1 hypothetical protein BDP55DRAFT_645340 [Colletotrichum godetiae]